VSGAEGELDASVDLVRAVLALPAAVAPFKAAVLPLDGRIGREALQPIVAALAAAGLSAFVDESAQSIGRRYARADEIGTPFAVTVDFESARDGRVTLRERDSMQQLRLPAERVARVVRDLCEGAETWAGLCASQK
jgi:glycyl-tRNA synthetase